MLLGSREVVGLQLAAPFGLFPVFCADRWEINTKLSGQVQACLHAGLEPLHGGPQIRHVAVPPTPVAEKPAFRVNVEARIFVVMFRVRAASDKGLPTWFEFGVVAGELRKIDTLTQHLEDVHLAHPDYHSNSGEHPSEASWCRMGYL